MPGSIPPARSQVLDFFGTPIVIEPSAGQLSSDAGLLPVRQFDDRIGLTRAFTDALDDPRDPDLTEHPFREMVRSRVYGILAGYEDQNDHDTLRTDPVLKLLAGRSPDDDDLASQPTLSRFENAISIKSLKRLRDVFLDQFIASFNAPPPRHLPLVITCADNDQFVMLSLRPGNVHAALGADDDLTYLVTRLRQVWPDVVLHLRGDCGFGVPDMYDVCERLQVSYTFGLSPDGRRMLEVIEGLPEDEREVFDLVGIQGLTHAEAAGVVGVLEKTVQRRLNRARACLPKGHGRRGGLAPPNTRPPIAAR
jgi:hypothetical protein